MAKITRVGVTFPPELLRDLDAVVGKMGYESRSKAIQDAVTLFVSEKNKCPFGLAVKCNDCLYYVYEEKIK